MVLALPDHLLSPCLSIPLPALYFLKALPHPLTPLVAKTGTSLRNYHTIPEFLQNPLLFPTVHLVLQIITELFAHFCVQPRHAKGKPEPHKPGKPYNKVNSVMEKSFLRHPTKKIFTLKRG